MPLFKTLLGEVNLYFKDFYNFTNFLNSYYKALTDPIESPTGNTGMPLIGIDGNPTTDETLFGNRQAIIYNFLIMRNGYVQEYGNTSIVEFYNTNIDKILSHSATFNRLYGDYKKESMVLSSRFQDLSKETKQYEEFFAKKEKESEKAEEITRGLKLRILECLRFCEKLKRILGAAHEYNIELMLIKMMTGFIRDGIGFFEEDELFEDVNHDRLLEFYKDYQTQANKMQGYVGIIQS